MEVFDDHIGQMSIEHMDAKAVEIKKDESVALQDRVEDSYRVLRLASEMSRTYYNKPLVLCYSGGKDSDVILRLAEECLRPDEFEVLHSHTTVDAPETVRYVEETFKRLNRQGIKTGYHNRFPVENTMWDLIVKKKMPPTRTARYCCAVLKETGTPHRVAILGVRAGESANRQGREVFGIRGQKRKHVFFSTDHAEEVHRESQEINDPAWDCTLIRRMKENGDATVNAIYDWTDADVWDFIEQRGIKTNPLYKKGFHRIGCILCPLAGYREKLFEMTMYPKYAENYVATFQRMIEAKECENTTQKWKTGEDVFRWWIEQGKYEIPGQMSLFDENNELNER